MQPPSGGCVLKQDICLSFSFCWNAAAFGRLCVETNVVPNQKVATPSRQPPSGGCVLKLTVNFDNSRLTAAAAFGRLCVETI